MNYPPNVKKALSLLADAGFCAYIVGGSLRDMMLKKEPHDWDITTSALPSEILSVFSDYRTIPTGLQHGTVSVIIDGGLIEITTYRIDGEYSDSRHPDSVRFTDDIALDLARRDFTVNAMAYNEQNGLVDLFSGKADLDRKVIRCVGIPEQRFCEDALRILRALRFASKLGFEIESETLSAMQSCRSRLADISRERIQTELFGILCGQTAERTVGLMCSLGIDSYVFCRDDNSPLTYAGLDKLENKPETRIAYLLRNDEYPVKSAVAVMRSLRSSNASLTAVTATVRGITQPLPKPTPENARRLMNAYGKHLDSVLDILSVIGDAEEVSRIRELIRIEAESSNCRSLSELKLRGNDISELGIASGKAIGIILERLLDEVIKDPEKNTRTYLLERAKYISTEISTPRKE